MTVRPTVLFIGDDASSTQIAESLLRHLVGDAVEIHTAGARQPDPGGREDQMLVMMGLNPAHEEPIRVRLLNTSDWVIILGMTLDVARAPGRRYEEWDITTDDLEERVAHLAAELTRVVDEPEGSDHGEQKRLRALVQHLRRRQVVGASRKFGQIASAARLMRRHPHDRRRS